MPKYPASVAADRRSLLGLMATNPWFIRLANIQFREASSNPSCDAAVRRSFGEFMLIEPYGNCLVAGQRFDMTAEDVIEFCADHTHTTDGGSLRLALFFARRKLNRAHGGALAPEIACRG
jgi:hypothetical protein